MMSDELPVKYAFLMQPLFHDMIDSDETGMSSFIFPIRYKYEYSRSRSTGRFRWIRLFPESEILALGNHNAT
jgi:hypothetical protein